MSSPQQMKLDQQNKQLQAQQEALKAQQEKFQLEQLKLKEEQLKLQQQALQVSKDAITTTASPNIMTLSNAPNSFTSSFSNNANPTNVPLVSHNDNLTTTTTTANTDPSYIRPPVGHKPVTSVLQVGDEPLMINWRTRERQWELEELDREKQLEVERERAAHFAKEQKEKARREKEKALKEIEASLLYNTVVQPSSTASTVTISSSSTATGSITTASNSMDKVLKDSEKHTHTKYRNCTL